MDNNASTNETPGTPVESQPVETSIPQASNRRKIKWPFVIGGVIVIVLGVTTAAFLVNRSRSASGNDNIETQEAQLSEYKNPNGFAFEYPKTMQLVPTEEGIRLNGETELTFMVKAMEEPLEVTVNEIADNFGIDKTTHNFSSQTINSRIGFVLLYEGKEYHYFPLYGNYYLEIVMDELDQTGMAVLDTLKFTPPQATLN